MLKYYNYRFVDGGGVTATIVDSNIRTTNGIIHQVDKVFFNFKLTDLFI